MNRPLRDRLTALLLERCKRDGAALVAWHDRQSVRAAWIGGR